MKTKKKGLKKNIGYIAAFLLPVLIFLFIFAVLKVYPFGERSIINSDLYHQYLPIMSELQRKIHTGESIFYSFNAGLGTNFYSLSAYQNASPITWLFLAVFSEDNIVLCVTLMVLFKTGLISASMYWYMRKFVNSEDPHGGFDASILMLAVLFSLNGYVIAYYTNVMWLDSIIMLPICVGGLRKSASGQGDSLFIISLAVLIISNYYIAAMVCIFLALYYLALCAGGEIQDALKTTLKMAKSAFISVLMSMFVLLPTFLALQKTEDYADLGIVTESFFYDGIATHLTQLLPNSNVTIVEGPANLYSGLISLILLLVYATTKDIGRRKKASRIVLIVFVYISTNVVPLDMVWNYMHIPNGFPARYSFIFSFLLIETAAEVIEGKNVITKKNSAIAFAVVTLLYAASLFAGDSYELNKTFMLISGAILMTIYGFVFFIINDEDRSQRNKYLAIAILFEVILCSFRGIGAGSIVNNNDYAIFKDDIAGLIKTAEEKDPYCRIEIIGSDNEMPPYVYGYRGLSLFASSAPHDTYDTLRLFADGGSPKMNKFKFRKPNEIGDSFLNLRYYITIGAELNEAEYTRVANSGRCSLYENRSHSSLGFMVPEGMKSGARAMKRSETLNEFIKSATGVEGVLEEGQVNKARWETASVKLYSQKMNVTNWKSNKVRGDIDVTERGRLFINIPYDEGWRIRVDGAPIRNYEKFYGFISLPVDEGHHEIEMRFIPEGFIPGISISLLGLGIWIIVQIANRNAG